MDKETLTALQGSIKKWEAIVAGTGEDRGTNNCLLCQHFVLETDTCEGCPVAEAVGEDSCADTPYDAWADHHYEAHKTQYYKFPRACVPGCETCLELAKKELNFLKSLLPSEAP